MPYPLTIIYSYYRQPEMLAYQIVEWNKYPNQVRIILVDDCSPEPALPVIEANAKPELLENLSLYCTKVDKPWARETCRNLSAKEAQTEWMVMLDLDHVLPADCIPALLMFQPDPDRWYRFERWRRGRADHTRNKDKIPRDVPYGKIHPHVDSYLIRRSVFWDVGAYDETFVGVLAGGSEFLKRLSASYQWDVLPDMVRLEVVTTDIVSDASDRHCDRDRQPGKEIEKQIKASGRRKPMYWLTLPWEKVL